MGAGCNGCDGFGARLRHALHEIDRHTSVAASGRPEVWCVEEGPGPRPLARDLGPAQLPVAAPGIVLQPQPAAAARPAYPPRPPAKAQPPQPVAYAQPVAAAQPVAYAQPAAPQPPRPY